MLILLEIYCIFWSVLLIHEAGHYFMSRWLGHYVPLVSLGAGPKIKIPLDGTDLLIGPLPFEGFVRSSTQKTRDGHRRLMWVALAGPLANLLALVVVCAVGWGIGWTPALSSQLGMNLATILSTLIPVKDSDGSLAWLHYQYWKGLRK